MIEKAKAENLKEILAGYGITTSKELDDALNEALNGLTIGIMTEHIEKVQNTA